MGLVAPWRVGSSQVRCFLHWQADSLPLNHREAQHFLINDKTSGLKICLIIIISIQLIKSHIDQ